MRFKNFIKKIFSWDSFIIFLGLLFIVFFIIVYGQPAFRSLLYALLITTFIFTVLFLLIKKFRFETYGNFAKYILMFIFLFDLSFFISAIYQNFEMEKDFKSYLAHTENLEKAKEIQKLDKYIIIDKHSYNEDFGLKILNCVGQCRDYYLIEIAKLYPNNDEVHIETDYIFNSNPDKIKKEKEKTLTRIIKKINDVREVKVEIKNFNNEKAFVNIDVLIRENTDEKEIERIINNLIYYKLKRKINIIYDYDKIKDSYYKYQKRINELHKESEYDEIDKVIKEAKHVLPQKYTDYFKYLTDNWKKYDELNRKIKKQPNNYKYYVERADLSYYPQTDCRPRMFYTDNLVDYEKALSLNPKSVELYEKAGDEACTSGNLEKIELYYNKALEYTENKDNIYAKLGDVYYSTAKALNSKEGYQKALDYYSKIDDVQGVIKYREELKKELDKFNGLAPYRIAPVPAKGNPWWEIPKTDRNVLTPSEKRFYWNKDDLDYRIFDCQRKLKMKKEARQTCKNKAKTVKNEGKNFNTFSNCYLKTLFD